MAERLGAVALRCPRVCPTQFLPLLRRRMTHVRGLWQGDDGRPVRAQAGHCRLVSSLANRCRFPVRHATGIRQGHGVSLGISAVPSATR